VKFIFEAIYVARTRSDDVLCTDNHVFDKHGRHVFCVLLRICHVTIFRVYVSVIISVLHCVAICFKEIFAYWRVQN